MRLAVGLQRRSPPAAHVLRRRSPGWPDGRHAQPPRPGHGGDEPVGHLPHALSDVGVATFVGRVCDIGGEAPKPVSTVTVVESRPR
jgi:hypothetical protein